MRSLAVVSFIESLITFVWLASIPSSGGAFSPVRLASLFGILLVSLGCLTVIIYVKSENKFTKTIERLANNGRGILASFPLITISFAAWVTILYKDWLLLTIDEAVYTRLLPIAILGVLLCLQAGIFFFIPNIKQDAWSTIFDPVWKPTAILLGCFLAIWAFMSATHIGFVFDNVGLSWGPPGTPITFAQVNLVFAVSLLLAFAYGIFGSGIRLRRILIRDIFVLVGLWGLAVFLWSNEAVSATHFNPPPVSPNYETYPNSDALIFDRSSYHLINGAGFNDHLIRRPLYVGMLALFHELGGFKYDSTVFLQIIPLAFIPSLTYLLTSKLSNRLAGLIAGCLILLREKNAIELSDKIVTANAKLMMSDMAAMLGVIAFVYLMVKVLSRKERNIWLLGVAGASLGLTALVRAQVLILVPLVILFLFIDNKPAILRAKDAILIILGLVLVMSPWLLRNWNLTGAFVLDDQGEEKLLARNYSANPVEFPPSLPAETEKEYSARIRRGILDYIVEHPSDVAFFVSNHFLRNMGTSVVYVTPAYSTDSPHSLVSQTPFWDEWEGSLTGNSPISLLINLAILALGISAAQSKNRQAGWFPFAAFLFYSAGNALVRTSGWRFSLPVDWVVLVYYSIALAYLPIRIKSAFNESIFVNSASRISPVTHNSFSGVIVFCILILAGASVPIAERLISAKDFSNLDVKAKERLLLENILPQEEIQTFLEQENAVFYSGMALYPRYIGDRNRIYLAYAPDDFTFFHFWLINDDDNQIVLPLQNSPDVFPHTSTVSVIGCRENNYILAWAVVLHTPEEKIIVQEPRSSLSCPLPEPKQN